MSRASRYERVDELNEPFIGQWLAGEERASAKQSRGSHGRNGGLLWLPSRAAWT